MHKTNIPRRHAGAGLAAALLAAGFTTGALASSHREAPSITKTPKADGTDFYMFRSYEGVAADGAGGRSGFVTLIANYLPLQDPYGGPNYFKMDPNALYEIHIDNNGDANEDITFQFQFNNTLKDVQLDIGGKMVSIPLTQAGQITAPDAAASNVRETYTVNVVRGDRRGDRAALTNAAGGSAPSLFNKPVDNIGEKTIPDYAAYARQHVYNVNIPGCAAGKLFVGQRQEAFAVNLGPIFDLVNAPLAVITDPTLINAAPQNSIQDKNVTTMALEVPIACLTGSGNGVIGGWTTASLRQGRLLSGAPRNTRHENASFDAGPWTQVSRLGMPLVNEVVIGLKDKDRFNASEPSGDGQFADYVTNPTLPALLGIALADGNAAAVAPTNYPRTDLVTTFLTGIRLGNGDNLNQMSTVTASEMLRLNTAVAPVPFAQQNRLGVVGNILAGGNDLAGFPNGRRPKDDIVDISLVAVLGGLCLANGNMNALGFGMACNPAAVPTTLKGNGSNGVPSVFNVHDAVDQAAVPLLAGFPYLNTPNPGAANP